jgi:hypothetical protein
VLAIVAFVVIRLRAVRQESRELRAQGQVPGQEERPPATSRERGAHRADRTYSDRGYRG